MSDMKGGKMDKVLYKWLVDGKTSDQKFKWPVKVGEWTEPLAPSLCKSGWHACYERDVLTHLPQEHAALWVVEVKGELVKGNDKIVSTQMRLVRKIGTTDDRKLRLFAADCAEDVLPIFQKGSPDYKRVFECIQVVRRF